MTGSEKAGSAVGEVAGRHMKKVVLELGGSDPFVVLDDADVDAAAKAAVIGRLANGGQACTASKRFIVEDRVYDEFVAKLIDGMAGWQPADPTNPETKLGPLASNSGAEELDELVQEAISRGAEVLLGGNRSDGRLVLAHRPGTRHEGDACLQRGAVRSGGRRLPRRLYG